MTIKEISKEYQIFIYILYLKKNKMKSKKQGNWIKKYNLWIKEHKMLYGIILLLSLIIIIIGCVSILSPDPKEVAINNVRDEYAKLPQFEGKSPSQVCWDIDGRLCRDKYEAYDNSYGEGIVVVLSGSGIWVVKEDKIYAINGDAKGKTPNLEYLKGEEGSNILNKFV